MCGGEIPPQLTILYRVLLFIKGLRKPVACVEFVQSL